MPSVQELVDAILQADKLSLAKLLTKVERDNPDVPSILTKLFPYSGKAYRIGFTGPPGAGKSTITDQLTKMVRTSDGSPTVSILAVDPTSPFTGGAILGDRIRMQQHSSDDGVFVRSMATRGSHGGLPITAGRAVTAMEASGKDYVIIETVGVGQTELDIMEVADTVVVVLVPEAGDSIQTMKAGLMEIADVFVINKADRDGGDKLAREIQQMLHLSPNMTAWIPPVLLTEAHRGSGIVEMHKAISDHRVYLSDSGELEIRRRRRRSLEFFKSVESQINTGLHELIANHPELQAFVDKIEKGELDPYSATAQVLQDKVILQQWLASL